MKKSFFVITISLVLAAFAAALVPQYINYQGILRNSTGDLQDGAFSMIFKIYDAEPVGTGNAVFNAAGSTTSVSVSNGLYSVRLGPVDSSVFDGSDRWLEVTVGSDTLSPRLRINSVAYAITADTAETATSANYAVISGTATNAANADTVDNLSANTTPTAGELYPLDGSGNLSGVPVSAEASGSNYALYINGGKIGVKTGTNMSVGTGEVNGSSQVVISNVPITANSLIFLTVGHAASLATNASDLALKIYDVNPGSGTLTVRTIDNTTPTNPIPFSYLIIN